MTAEASRRTMSVAEYVAREEASKDRHEYLRGEVYAMAGGTPEHGALAAACITALSVALRERPCRVYSSDVRVRSDATDLFTYADAFVVCGSLDRSAKDGNAVANPVVVVEVLSPATESYDRGAKAEHYRRIVSLREYVLVNHALPRIEVFRKNDAGRFEWFLFEAHEVAELVSIGVQIPVAEIYRDPLA